MSKITNDNRTAVKGMWPRLVNKGLAMKRHISLLTGSFDEM